VGLIVMAVGISFGANAGYAINPARDFGPRIFAAIAGWGKVAFPGDYGNINDYFWIPIVGPLVGAGIAAFVYDFFIQDILKARHSAAQGLKSMGEVVEETPPSPAENF
jgi:glycerol uptake facilitator protein